MKQEDRSCRIHGRRPLAAILRDPLHSKMTRSAASVRAEKALGLENCFVPILYRVNDFGAFDDFSNFLESISCETSKSCQVRGSILGEALVCGDQQAALADGNVP